MQHIQVLKIRAKFRKETTLSMVCVKLTKSATIFATISRTRVWFHITMQHMSTILQCVLPLLISQLKLYPQRGDLLLYELSNNNRSSC